ncbi:hypothetical protein KBX53_28920, partial [Micromonospora sp. M51]|nr:hypothetical protein [Micromonospora sp. M51]
MTRAEPVTRAEPMPPTTRAKPVIPTTQVGPVTVVGLDAAGAPPHPALAPVLAAAGLVVGAARHLAAVPV